MPRIWYSVCGEGYGHATRSDVVIRHLLKRHEVIITAYGKAYDYLKPKYGSAVHEIDGNTYMYEDNTLRVGKSMGKLLIRLPVFAWKNLRRLRKLIVPFHPDLLITDFESASAYYALIAGIPVMNLDNIHALKEFDEHSAWYVRAGMKLLQPKGDAYVIPCFWKPCIKGKRSHVIPPLVRNEVRSVHPRDSGHAIVYQTSSTYARMLPILKKTKRRFIIYGMGAKGQDGNLVFKPFTDREFIRDLAGASYVVINGGFTLISEALALKKPVLAIPVRNQIEQVNNAQHIAQMGVGALLPELTLDAVNEFERNLPLYTSHLTQLPRWTNVKGLQAIDRIIADLVKVRRAGG